MNRLTIDQDWACIEITTENMSSMLKRPACPSPMPPIVIGGVLYREYGMSTPGVEIRTSGESVTGRLVDETLCVWLLGGRSFLRLLRIAFYRTLDWDDCVSGSFDAVTTGMHGYIVQHLGPPRFGRCQDFDGSAQCRRDGSRLKDRQRELATH